MGQAINLKNRLSAYNNNKLHNFKVIKYISCKSAKLMDATEHIILSKFNKYKCISDRDVFQLPDGKDISFFTQWFDHMSKMCEDIEEGVILEERTDKEKEKLSEEKYEAEKESVSEFNRQYRENHHEDILDREKTYRENNREFLKEVNRNYRLENPEKEATRRAKYASEHKDEIKERMIVYRKEKATEIAKTRKKYNLEHKEENEAQVRCECGSVVSKQNLSYHFNTDLHKKFLETGLSVQEQRKEASVICECGMTISKRGIKRHQLSKVHKQFVECGIKIKCV